MKFTTTSLLSLAVFLASTFQVNAFSTPNPQVPAVSPVSPLAEEAAKIYSEKYNFVQEGAPRTLTGITEEKALTSFNDLAAVYGDDRALNMVKISPISLAFDSAYFQEVFEIWAEQFGEEETKEMVLRNPGLLSVKPAYAKKTDGSTMVFSYIVAATRPIGLFGPFIIVALILAPLLESITGISLTRQSLFGGN